MRRPAPGSPRGVVALLLAALLLLAGPLTGSPAPAAGTRDAIGDRTAQAGRHADDDAASVGSTRLSPSRNRTAAPRAQLDSGAAHLPTVVQPSSGLHEHSVPGARDTAAPAAPRRATHSRAPPA